MARPLPAPDGLPRLSVFASAVSCSLALGSHRRQSAFRPGASYHRGDGHHPGQAEGRRPGRAGACRTDCLPNFQRDFVWTREEVADLVRSIVRGYFIGSLLLLRCDKDNPPFAPVFLRGSKPLHSEPHPELLVLDGQQRLSSLIYALTAPDLSLKDSSKRRWFFINLDVLLEEPDNDEIVVDRARREFARA